MRMLIKVMAAFSVLRPSNSGPAAITRRVVEPAQACDATMHEGIVKIEHPDGLILVTHEKLMRLIESGRVRVDHLGD
jgi:hypothetical protein